MWGFRKYSAIAALGAGLGVAAATPALSQCGFGYAGWPGAYGYGGCGGHGFAGYGGCGGYGYGGCGGYRAYGFDGDGWMYGKELTK